MGEALGQDAGNATPGASNLLFEVTFRDPPPAVDRAAPLKQALAKLLVSAPVLPVEIPRFDLNLLDIEAPRGGVDLVLGKDAPIASLCLRAAPDGVARAEVRSLNRAAERFRDRLHVMAGRVAASITAERWEEAQGLGAQLRRLPLGVPLGFMRQAVPGIDFLQGIVRTGFRCNQDCSMCWQDRDWGAFGPEQILTWIEDLAAAGAARLSISGGEPTLDKRLEDYIRRAREGGIGHVSLETNAILLARPGRVEALVEAGLGGAFVSLHSPDPAVSDAITRAPGTHQKTIEGIKRLLDARIGVRLNAVITKQGLPTLPDMPATVLEHFGHARDQINGLMVSYPSEAFDKSLMPSILPEPLRVRRVLRQMIERGEECGLMPQDLDGPCGPPLCAFGADPRVADLKPIQTPVNFRHQVEACEHCAVSDACYGVRPAALDRFGGAALAPLTFRPEAGGRLPENDGRALLLNLTTFCNARCEFCMVLDSLNRPERNMKDEEISAALGSAREGGATEVGYTGGEPSLHKRFVAICAEAKALGYTDQQITTNGIKFKKRDFARRCLDAGLSSVDLSIHGHTDELHDRLVGKRGALSDIRQACAHFAELRREGRSFDLGATVVVVDSNAEHLKATCELVAGLGVDYIRIKYAYAADSGRGELLDQVPPYDAVVPHLSAAIEALVDGDCLFAFRHVPLCLVGDHIVFAKDFEARHVTMAFHDRQETGDPAQRERDDTDTCAQCAVANCCTRLDSAYEQKHGRPTLRRLSHEDVIAAFDRAAQRYPDRRGLIELTRGRYLAWRDRDRPEWTVREGSIQP